MSEPSLPAILDAYNAAPLDRIARLHGLLPKTGKTKSRVLKILAEALPQADRVLNSYRDLDIGERAVVDAILRRGGQTSLRNLRSEVAALKLIDPQVRVEHSYYGREQPDPNRVHSRRLEDLVARLALRGLVFCCDDMQNGEYAGPTKHDFFTPVGQVCIPKEIRVHLPEPPQLPQPEAAPLEVRATLEGSARTFQRDLYLYWGFVRDHKPSLTARGEVNKRALRDLNAILLVRAELVAGESENDHPRLRFLRALLESLSLTSVSLNGELAVTGQTDFFALPPDERVRQVFESWREGRFFNELLVLPASLRPRPSSMPLLPAHTGVLKARRFVLDQAHQLAQTGWATFRQLSEAIRDQNYEFLFPRPRARLQYYYGLHHPYDATTNNMGLTFPGVYREEQGWEQVEANFIRTVIAGPLFWMGLVDLGWEETSAPEASQATAFRLTDLGRWLFGLGPLPEIPVEGGRVVVQPNLHIIALDPVQEATLVKLDSFAERLSAERAVEYRLTRASVYAAQKAGWDAGQIIDFLSRHTGADLPPNVIRTLEEWQALHERIVIRSGLTLAQGLPEALDRLAADERAAERITGRPHPAVIVLKGRQNILSLAKILQDQDVVPLIVVKGALPANSVSATPEGELTFQRGVPGLYLHGHLAAFAEPAGDGYRITRLSVLRAVRTGITAPAIIERLSAVHTGPLPDKLEKRIRAWAGHYGVAALETVTLLQLRDAQTLAELLEDPEVGPLLQAFTPKHPQALARVRPADLERLRQLLAERGVDLSDHLT